MNIRRCSDLDIELTTLLDSGYRLDMIMPADAPREAIVSKDGEKVLLKSEPHVAAVGSDRVMGRAGMEYRDLIPGRLGGRMIASHIRIIDGGEVPDYVHYHKLRFQMIYCMSGWVRVVYEDQGRPFVMNAGDCVLQPPEIRHRVLEASAGAEVIEVSSPAEHETWVDHALCLPTKSIDTDRLFSGQRFVRHIAAHAAWKPARGMETSDTGISAATDGLADVRVHRSGTAARFDVAKDGIAVLIAVSGSINGAEECVLYDDGEAALVEVSPGTQILHVTLFGNSTGLPYS